MLLSRQFLLRMLLMSRTSEISGSPSIVTGEFAKIDAGIKATALFFAPLTLIVPCRRFTTLNFINVHVASPF